jgi:hypothetical protein
MVRQDADGFAALRTIGCIAEKMGRDPYGILTYLPIAKNPLTPRMTPSAEEAPTFECKAGPLAGADFLLPPRVGFRALQQVDERSDTVLARPLGVPSTTSAGCCRTDPHHQRTHNASFITRPEQVLSVSLQLQRPITDVIVVL